REKTFRHEITDTYKANRPPAPDELHQQVEPIKEFFAAIGLQDISKAGYEADDVIATLAEKYKDKFDIIIVSGDKDFAQLVEDRVTLYDPKKSKSMNAENILEKYEITPEQFIDYLAICGDSADNIPGVRGIGPKGASKLLNEFETLDGIYENLDRIQAKGILEKLTEHKEDAYLSKKLVTIIRDVPIEIPDEELNFDKGKLQNGIDILNAFELSSIAKKIKKLFSQPKVEPKVKEVLSFTHEFDFNTNGTELKYQTILTDTKESFAKMLTMLETADIVAFDTETTSKDPHLAELVGISICAEVNRSHYIPLRHQMAQNLDPEEVLTQLKDKLKSKILVAHNSKYDLLILENAGWKIEENIFDTIIAHYLINPTSRHSLAHCALEEFGHEMIPISELIG
ncbi:MAG: DNA polymerase I, partial [Candidatus Delongbacteria bacterium]|nr:DNA polymerase I [Candidatus Delongbacteria bacterium]